MKIDGKKIAEKIISGLRRLPKPDRLLSAILVGNNPQSLSFLKQKEGMAESLGVSFHLYRFDESITQNDLISEIKKIGDDPEVGGMIIQLPLPAHYDRDAALAAINPKKDIDAMTSEGRKLVSALPVEVIKDVLDSIGQDISNKEVAVVGRGFLVGKPIMEWLDSYGKSYKALNSKSDISEIRGSDVIITGVGKAGIIKQEHVGSGCGVIDFGYDLIDGKIKGDFIPDESFSGWYTPTPGGTGPVLVAEIFKNFYKLNK